MDIDLNDDQRDEMNERSSDVALLARMMSTGSRQVTMETAYLAWRRNSDSSCAGWLTFDEFSVDEVSSAFTSFVLDRIRSDAENHFERIQDQVVDHVRNRLDREPVQPGEEILTVKTIDASVVLGRMSRSSSLDIHFVDEICERFDHDLSEHAVMFERRIVLEQIGLQILDDDGNHD